MKKLLLLPILFLFLTACNNSEKIPTEELTKETKTMEKVNESNRPLEKILNAKKANFELKASDEKKKIYAKGIEDVVNNSITKNALQIGEKAIDFSLKNAKGENISLYKSLENGPVVLMWYRGGWCPYCNLTLHEMQEALPEIKKYNAKLFALSPELPDSSISTKEKNELEFEVLSDIDNKVAHDYKIVYTLIKDVANIYENGFGLSKYNGNEKSELPLAATYIIGTDKIIKYAFLDEDYRNRAEPIDIIETLKKIKNN